MGAVEDTVRFLATMHRGKKENLADFAARLYMWQMESYSASAGHDLGGSFWSLPEDERKGWYDAARHHNKSIDEMTMELTGAKGLVGFTLTVSKDIEKGDWLGVLIHNEGQQEDRDNSVRRIIYRSLCFLEHKYDMDKIQKAMAA